MQKEASNQTMPGHTLTNDLYKCVSGGQGIA